MAQWTTQLQFLIDKLCDSGGRYPYAWQRTLMPVEIYDLVLYMVLAGEFSAIESVMKRVPTGQQLELVRMTMHWSNFLGISGEHPDAPKRPCSVHQESPAIPIPGEHPSGDVSSFSSTRASCGSTVSDISSGSRLSAPRSIVLPEPKGPPLDPEERPMWQPRASPPMVIPSSRTPLGDRPLSAFYPIFEDSPNTARYVPELFKNDRVSSSFQLAGCRKEGRYDEASAGSAHVKPPARSRPGLNIQSAERPCKRRPPHFHIRVRVWSWRSQAAKL